MGPIRFFNCSHRVIHNEIVLPDAVKFTRIDEGRDKLVIGLSANGDGFKILTNLLYNTLSPDTKLDILDRFLANEVLEAICAADYTILNAVLMTNSFHNHVDAENKSIETGSSWLGPYTPLSTEPDLFYNEHSPGEDTVISEPPFEPENILTVPDGTCESSCNIFADLLTGNQGVRNLALRGAGPQNLAMVAMRGMKGSKLSLNSDIAQSIQRYAENISNDSKAIKTTKDVKESIHSPGLRPHCFPYSWNLAAALPTLGVSM
ncbi:hypothetical protein LZL87_012632 [Fusarium oxysporum]|nr:hypothetical protein LZL87_012632 [Fusarium oxysporum]